MSYEEVRSVGGPRDHRWFCGRKRESAIMNRFGQAGITSIGSFRLSRLLAISPPVLISLKWMYADGSNFVMIFAMTADRQPLEFR